MSISNKIKFFLSKGRKNKIYEGRHVNQFKEPLVYLTIKQPAKLLPENWDNFSEDVQRRLVEKDFLGKWRQLIRDYPKLEETQQLEIIEILAYIPEREVVDFLMEEMKSLQESICLAASFALKKQDSDLILDPMLYALTQPDQWLPSRVLEVLRGLGAKLLDPLFTMIEDVDPKVQSILVQVLGEIGDVRCLPVFAKLARSTDEKLRLRVAEALKELSFKDSFPVLLNLLDDDKWQIRMHAAQGLGNLGLEEIEDILEKRLTIEKDPLVRDCIKESMAKIQKDTLPQVIGWIREESDNAYTIKCR